MKLLLVIATKEEINGVLEHFNLSGEGFIEHPKFDTLITGVGMTATAFALGRYLNNTYHFVLNLGIAGSFDDKIPLGSLVSVETDIFAELGAEDHENFIPIDELGFGSNTYHSTYPDSGLKKVKGITVNKVHGNATSISLVKSRFSADIESMEGAAVFYACQMSKVPCLQVRAISNYVEPRDKERWKIGLAIKNLNDWAIDFIEKYDN